jgi:hypothetical protein
VVLGAFAQPVGASHAGAIADCGSAGTFTVRAQDNSADFQSPAPDKLVLFEEGRALTVLELSVDGQLIFSRAETGRTNNSRQEVTCSFTLGAGPLFTVTGILSAG